MNSFKRINRSALSELIVHRKSHIISLILLGISGLTYLNTTMGKDSDIDPYFLSLLFFFASLFPLFFTCVNVFKDMHDVPSADVQMAMPLSSAERFLSRIMTIGYVWFFPYLAISSFGNIGSALLNQFLRIEYSYPAPIPEMIAANMKIMLLGTSFSLFIIGVTVLSACCVGTKAEAIYLPGILMITISVLPVETVDFIRGKFADISTGIYHSSFLGIFGFSNLFGFFDDSHSVLVNIINCLISVLLIFIAMHAYKKRDAKTVGYPVVYRVFFEFVLCSSLAVFFQLIHNSNYGVELIALFVFFVGSLILRMIVSRKDITLVKIIKWSGMFAVYYALFIAFSFAACMTGGFGMKNTDPDTSMYPSNGEYSCNIYYYVSEINNYTSKEIMLTEDGVHEVAEICSDFITKQNRSKYYFTDSMIFGLSRHHKEYQTCSVSINYAKPRDAHYDYYDNFYMAEFTLNKNDVKELDDLISSIGYSKDQ